MAPGAMATGTPAAGGSCQRVARPNGDSMAPEYGIETTYRGVRFRSRAEARWAAFFDEVGWRWSYEPIDAGGYIPDFLLHFDRPMFVEVKGAAVIFGDLEIGRRKLLALVRGSGHRHGLILGAAPFPITYESDLIVGELVQDDPQPDDPPDQPGWWSVARPSGPCGGAKLSLYHGDGAFDCVLCGAYEGGGGPHPDTGRESDIIAEAWAKACNATQWRRTA